MSRDDSHSQKIAKEALDKLFAQKPLPYKKRSLLNKTISYIRELFR